MSRPRLVEAVQVADVPELRAAYAAETAAVAWVADLKARLLLALELVVTQTEIRDGLAGRAARGEAVTGADVRAANDAVTDAEADVALLRAALPQAAREAMRVSRERHAAEADVIADHKRPYREAFEAAKLALEAATLAHLKAGVEADRLPDAAQDALDEVLDAHGRDDRAVRAVDEMRRVEQANETRKRTGQPLVAWP